MFINELKTRFSVDLEFLSKTSAFCYALIKSCFTCKLNKKKYHSIYLCIYVWINSNCGKADPFISTKNKGGTISKATPKQNSFEAQHQRFLKNNTNTLNECRKTPRNEFHIFLFHSRLNLWKWRYGSGEMSLSECATTLQAPSRHLHSPLLPPHCLYSQFPSALNTLYKNLQKKYVGRTLDSSSMN